jgi:hypothetical protein
MLNLTVEAVSVAGALSEPRRALWQAQSNPPLPWLVVNYPAGRELPQTVWAGNLNAEAIRRLVDSPARRELARRLTEGAAAVWVFLESGQKDRDDGIARLLEGESRRLEKTIKLPEPSPDDPPLRSTQAVQIAFQTVRLPRAGLAEQVLRNMLLRVDQELSASVEPMVFAVFGRGRALPPLVGKEITAAVLEEAASFLTAACSCQVKAMNPGFDLLLTADWDARLEDRLVKDPELPPLIGMSALAAAAAAPPAGVASTNPPPETVPRGRLVPNLVFVFGVGLMTLVIATLAIKARFRPPRQ